MVDYGPPATWPSNEYWGKRSGSSGPAGNVFKIKRGGGVNTGNSGPTGRAARKGYRQVQRALAAIGVMVRKREGTVRTKGVKPDLKELGAK